MKVYIWFFSHHTAVLRYLLCKKNEPELSLHFLVTSYDGQGHVYKRKIICGADLEKTYIWVILYYKIDHFCPLKINFHTFPAIWPNFWVWNSLLPSFYHLLVQLRHARSLFFPLSTNDFAKIKPRCKKYAVGFWKSRFILGQKSVFNHSYRCQEGNKKLLVYLTCTNKW